MLPKLDSTIVKKKKNQNSNLSMVARTNNSMAHLYIFKPHNHDIRYIFRHKLDRPS